MALPVAGRTRNLRRRHWLELADSIGLPLKAAVSAHRLALTAAASVAVEIKTSDTYLQVVEQVR